MKLLAIHVLNLTLMFICTQLIVAQSAKPQTYQLSRTPLMRAAERGNLPSVRRLLKRGADVNAKDIFGGTALMSAASKGHLESVKDLVAAGADPNALGATFHYGDFSVLIAAMEPENKDWLRIVDILIATGAEINPKGECGRCPLAHAVEKTSIAMIDALLDRGADVNYRNYAGLTALMFAATSLSPELVKHLISKGADVNARTKHGETALSALQNVPGDHSRQEREEIKFLLMKAGADK